MNGDSIPSVPELSKQILKECSACLRKSQFQKRVIDFDTSKSNFKIFELTVEWQLRMFLNYQHVLLDVMLPRRHSPSVSLLRKIINTCLLSECQVTTTNSGPPE